MKLRLSPAVLLLALGPGCALFQPSSVTRRIHGKTWEGRFVDEVAYTAYAAGALAEAQQDFDGAERAYLRAVALDPPSDDGWTRIGVVRCARGDRAGAETAFRRAAEIDPEYAPASFERARCGLARGELEAAARDALRAVALDPNQLEASLLVAEIAERRGDAAEARRWRFGLTAVLATRAPIAKARGEERAKGAVSDVDQAVRSNDAIAARRAAIAARLTPSALALRAVVLGNAAFARDHARLVLAADPYDADARVALLAAADRLGDIAAFDVALADVPVGTSPMSPLGQLLLAEVLRRRVGPEAAPRP